MIVSYATILSLLTKLEPHTPPELKAELLESIKAMEYFVAMTGSQDLMLKRRDEVERFRSKQLNGR